MSPYPSTITREEAARLLQISVRTLDRHIRRNAFDVTREGRHVWISRPSFERYYEAQKGPLPSTEEPPEITTVSRPKALDLHTVELSETDLSESEPSLKERIGARPSTSFTSHEHAYNLTPTHIYKTLYEELKTQHDEQVKRLEGAHYRVGQLEAQVKSMVPMLEYKKQRKQLVLMDQRYKETVQEARTKLGETKRRFNTERLNKNVYVSLVYALLALHVIFWGLLSN